MTRTPTEVLRGGQVYVSCEVEERSLAYVVERMGADQIFFPSDYPHERQRRISGDIPEFTGRTDLTDEIKTKILTENAIRFYRSGRRPGGWVWRAAIQGPRRLSRHDRQWASISISMSELTRRETSPIVEAGGSLMKYWARNFADGLKIGHVADVDDDAHHVVQRGAALGEQQRQVVQHATRLRADVAGGVGRSVGRPGGQAGYVDDMPPGRYL